MEVGENVGVVERTGEAEETEETGGAGEADDADEKGRICDMFGCFGSSRGG